MEITIFILSALLYFCCGRYTAYKLKKIGIYKNTITAISIFWFIAWMQLIYNALFVDDYKKDLFE